MNLVGDESLESRVVAALRSRSHHVLSIHEDHVGLPDTAVLQISVELGWPLITNDKDFGDLVFRQRMPSVGVVLLRMPYTPTIEKAERLAQWLATNPDRVHDHYTVLGLSSARVRRLASTPAG